MSDLQRLDQRQVVKAAIDSGRDCSCRKTVKSFWGKTIESQTIQVINRQLYVSDESVNPPVLGDWLQLVGGVTLTVIGGCLVLNMVRGVFIKSEVSGGQSVAGYVDGGSVGG